MYDEDGRNDRLAGVLHTYNVDARLTAFESGDINSPSTVLFIGGLGDGLSSVPYIAPLSRALQTSEWSLTQILMSSSYTGFGNGSIAQDVKEIRMCIDHLRDLGKKEFVLLGHSTGCQDIVRFFLDHNKITARDLGVKGVVLQGPISDREYIIETLGKDHHATSIVLAQKLVEGGKADEPVPSEYSDMFSGGKCAISASRWLSLALPYTSHSHPADSEDYFSSDLDARALRSNLGRLGDAEVPTAVIFSARDEGMPAHVDKTRLLERFLEALDLPVGRHVIQTVECSTLDSSRDEAAMISKVHSAVLQGAGHRIEEQGAMVEFIVIMIRFIKALNSQFG